MPKASGQYRVACTNHVKFDPKVSALPGLRHAVHRRACVALVAAFALPRVAGAQPSQPPLLLGGPASPEARTIETDPRLPVGPRFTSAVRPRSAGRACSDRFPLCVHAGDESVNATSVLDALSSLELAFERLVLALRLPAPLGDRGESGSDALDLYLLPSDSESPAHARVQVALSEPAASASTFGFDRAAAFCTAMADDRALLDRASTLCVGEAIALRLDPAETPHARRGFATALWWTIAAPTSVDFEAIQAVQSAPERALATSELGPTSEGSAILFTYLDEKLGASGPGTLAASLFSASAQRLEPNAVSWQNEPDTFDVLRHTLEESRPRVASLFGDLAVARGLVGGRDDSGALAGLGWSGSFGAPNFDWVLPFASLPRRVRLTPVEPTGVALVWVDLKGAPPGVPLGFQAEWEPPAQFQWVLVRIGEDGRELGRVEVPFQQKETRVEARLVDMGDARGVLIAGAHLEEVDGDHPFDPDVAPFEPHGAMVYVVEL
jgi:hypothetical protein